MYKPLKKPLRVKTPTGYREFDGIQKYHKDTYNIYTSNGNIITSDMHRFVVKGKEVFSKDLEIGSELETINGFCKVIKIEKGPKKDVYDLINVKNGEVYYTNGILSHNSFLGSSSTLITGSVLKSLSWIEEDKITFNNIFNGLRIFNEPESGHHYIVSVDPKKDGIDDAGIQVIDVTGLPFKQVACANLQESYLTAPSKVFDLGMYYNEALVVVENNLDQTIVDTLFYHYEYENIYKESHKKIQGFRTTTRTKKQILSFMKKFIEEGKLILQDELTINQLFSFIEKSNGSFSAEEGYKDDMIMALALTWAPFLDVKNFDDFKGMITLIESQKKVEDEEQELMSEFFDLGFNDDVSDDSMYKEKETFNGFDVTDANSYSPDNDFDPFE